MFSDDCFFINNKDTVDEIAQCLEQINIHQTLLKFKYEKSQTKMQVLDVLVFKGQRLE